jgi:hypothetical protein
MATHPDATADKQPIEQIARSPRQSHLARDNGAGLDDHFAGGIERGDRDLKPLAARLVVRASF